MNPTKTLKTFGALPYFFLTFTSLSRSFPPILLALTSCLPQLPWFCLTFEIPYVCLNFMTGHLVGS